MQAAAASSRRQERRAIQSKARQRIRSAERGRVVQDLPLWAHAARIGGKLTPTDISNIIREADAGDTRRLIDLYNECRQRDCHLQAVLATNEECIAALKYQIAAPVSGKGKDKTKPKAKDARAAQWVEDKLREVFGLRRMIACMAGAITVSFDYHEIVWTKGEGGRLVPARFTPIAPRRFKFRPIDGLHVLADAGKDEIDLVGTYTNKFITSFPRVTGDVPPREGLMRALVWMSVMRTWIVFHWMQTAEMAWKPWRVGKFGKDKGGRQDRRDMEEVMRRMNADLAAVIPDTSSIDVFWPGGTSSRSSTHAEAFKALGDEMSKCVLGQTETTQSSSSSGYAQSKIHNLVRKDLMEARAKQIADDLTRDLITPMVKLNFGETVAVPRFEFLTQDEIDLKAFGEAMKTLREAGMVIPQEWVSDQSGIPQRKKGEPALGEPDANAPEPEDPEAPGQGDGTSQDPKPTPTSDKPDPGTDTEE